MNLEQNRKQILEILSDGSHLKFKDISEQLSKQGLIFSCDFLLGNTFIARDLDDKYFLTHNGFQLLNALKEKDAYIKHEYRGGLRCVKCGLNKKAKNGNLYWYDNGPATTQTPPCRK